LKQSKGSDPSFIKNQVIKVLDAIWKYRYSI
jgi:hypothetical protein